MPELDLNRDIVQTIIDKARRFHAKEEVTFPEEDPLSPAEDWAMQVLADHADDPVVQELTSTVDALEPDQQAKLVALMWLGRGDYSLDEWSEAVAQAQDEWNGRTAEYLIGTPPHCLSRYPVRKIQAIVPRQTSMNTSVMPRLASTATSDLP
jgi:hypothetical protein